MPGRYRITKFEHKTRIARPGDPPTRAQPGDGAHVKTMPSTAAQEAAIEKAGRPANPTFAGYQQAAGNPMPDGC